MSSLTDRYAWAVVRLLPEEQRDEIDRELRELVAEMTDSRLAATGPAARPRAGPDYGRRRAVHLRPVRGLRIATAHRTIITSGRGC